MFVMTGQISILWAVFPFVFKLDFMIAKPSYVLMFRHALSF